MKEYDITIEELREKQLKGAIVIDVRNKRAYKESHIEGSINIPEYEINISILNTIKDKDSEVILYCSGGYRSMIAYKKLKKLGYTKVYNLYGGLENY